MRWRRHIRNWILAILGVVLVILASISVLVETQTGSRWLLQTIARWVPLELGEINGDLRSGLDISYVDYRNGQQHFRIEQASFRWRPVSLLYGALSIQSLQVQHLLIELPPSDKSRDPEEPFSDWPRIGLPIRVELGQAQINQIEFHQGDTRLSWESLSGSLSLGTFHLRYRDLGVVHKGYSLKLSGVSDLWFPYETDADLEWRIGAEDADSSRGAAFPYRGKGELTGDLRGLQLAIETKQPVVLEAEAALALVDAQDALVTAPHIQLNAKWNQQQLPGAWWIPGRVPPVTTAELKAEGNWQGYTAHLQGNLLAPDVPGVSVLAEVQGDTRGLQIKQLKLAELVAVTETSKVDEATPEVTDTEVIVEEAAPVEPVVSAKKEAFQAITQWLALTGKLAWLPGLEWNLDAQGEHLNLATLLVDWPSNLQLRFNSRGQMDYKSKDWRVALGQLLVDGSLRDLNLEIKGNLEADPRKWSSQGLRMVLGANQLDLKGGLDERLQLDWDLRAPMLGQLDTGISGSLISKGQLRGQLSLPRVAMDMAVENLSWRDYRLAQLALTVKPESTTIISPAVTETESFNETALRAAPYNLELSGRKLQMPGLALSSFSLKGNGSANQHQAQATVKSPRYGSLEFAIKGRYGEQDWTGSLHQASVKFKNVPRWWLVSGKPIHISATDISIGDQCFTTRTNLTSAIENNPVSVQNQAEWNPNQSPVDQSWLLKTSNVRASPIEKLPPPRLCLHGTWMPEPGIHINAKLDSVPLRQFYALFKPEVYFAGVMNGSFELSSRRFALEDIKADFDVTTRNAELRYQFSGGTTETYPWENTRLNATLDQGLFKASATMHWVGYGYMEANSQIDLLTQQINSGNLFARFDNLAPLETLVTAANDVAGDLKVDLDVGGKLQKPEISGVIHLHNGSANLPKIGLDLTGMQMQLTADKSERINIVGEMQSGKDSNLNLTAELVRLGSPEWQATGHLSGSDFRVINVPQLKININPNIDLHADAKTMKFSGEATIPWARAAIKTLPPSTTRVSSDVVIEDEQQLQTAANSGVEIFTNIKLALGDDVRFKGFGLDSQLSGEMQLFKDAQRRQLLTNGFVAVKKGTYKAYGQNLTIERGRLIFQGPYENPGLDIRASRTIEDEDKTQVGLEINGTLQRPTARVYSLPSHSDSEAMMMLLTGKPVTQESRAEATLLMGALSGLGGDSENLSTGIAHFFRVDELAINSDKGIDQSELWIGKQLTPKLMVRYVMGLFDQLVSLGVEYQLNDRMRVEAESGEKQSVDVIYRIER